MKKIFEESVSNENLFKSLVEKSGFQLSDDQYKYGFKHFTELGFGSSNKSKAENFSAAINRLSNTGEYGQKALGAFLQNSGMLDSSHNRWSNRLESFKTSDNIINFFNSGAQKLKS